MSYPIPEREYETVYEVKKSQFFARAGYVDSRESAMAMLAQCRERYPDARHHCWAYLLGSPASPHNAAMSDDGEPSGTAGKPILNVLQHKNIGDIMVVISRYFGGIKLGAGGLVRAYSSSAQQTIETLPVIQQVDYVYVSVKTDFSQEQYLRHWVGNIEGKVDGCDYSETVTLHLGIPDAAKDELQALAGSMGLTLVWHQDK